MKEVPASIRRGQGPSSSFASLQELWMTLTQFDTFRRGAGRQGISRPHQRDKQIEILRKQQHLDLDQTRAQPQGGSPG